MTLTARGLEVLSDSECVRLLQANDVGRLGVVDREGRPLILPVSYNEITGRRFRAP